MKRGYFNKLQIHVHMSDSGSDKSNTVKSLRGPSRGHSCPMTACLTGLKGRTV